MISVNGFQTPVSFSFSLSLPLNPLTLPAKFSLTYSIILCSDYRKVGFKKVFIRLLKMTVSFHSILGRFATSATYEFGTANFKLVNG